MTAPSPSASIVTGPAHTRTELRDNTWNATVTGAPPVEVSAARPGGPSRSFRPDDIKVSYLYVEDTPSRATSHGWRVSEIQLTGPWLPDPRTDRVIESTARGTLSITGLRGAPGWAQEHAAANAPAAILLTQPPADNNPTSDSTTSDSGETVTDPGPGFVARTGITNGTATDHDGVHVTAPQRYTEAVHIVTIPHIRGADPISISDTTSIDPRTLVIQFFWRTQNDDTDWDLQLITVTGTIHTDPPTDQPGPAVLLGRDDAPEWMLALALAKSPTDLLRFGTDAGTY